MSLNNNQRRMLRVMHGDAERTWSLNDLLAATGWSDQVHVAGAGKELAEDGLVEILESQSSMVYLGKEGASAVENGLLEARIWKWFEAVDDSNRNMAGLFSAGFERHEAGPGVGLLKALGISIQSGVFVAENKKSVAKTITSRTEYI